MADEEKSWGLTSAGYIKRDAETIKNQMVQKLQNSGVDFLNLPADIQNNLLDTAVVPIMEMENIVSDLITAYSPNYANDFIWNILATTMGLKRKKEYKASVELSFTGNPGVYIPEGTQVNSYETSKSVVIGTSGSVIVTAYSDIEEEAAANTLTQLNTIIDDSVKVTNIQASIPYISNETTEQMKWRAQAMLRNPRKGSYDFAKAKLEAVEGVNPRLIQFIETTITEKVVENGIDVQYAQKGIEAIIGGGTQEEVAVALFESFVETAKLISQPSNGETARTNEYVIDYFGSPLTIKWTRPKLISLDLVVTLKFKDVTLTGESFVTMLTDPLTNFINTRLLGVPFNKSSVDGFIFDILVDKGFDLDRLISLQYDVQANGADAQWNADNYLEVVQHDCYTELSGLVVNVIQL